MGRAQPLPSLRPPNHFFSTSTHGQYGGGATNDDRGGARRADSGARGEGAWRMSMRDGKEHATVRVQQGERAHAGTRGRGMLRRAHARDASSEYGRRAGARASGGMRVQRRGHGEGAQRSPKEAAPRAPRPRAEGPRSFDDPVSYCNCSLFRHSGVGGGAGVRRVACVCMHGDERRA